MVVPTAFTISVEENSFYTEAQEADKYENEVAMESAVRVAHDRRTTSIGIACRN